MSVNPLFLGVTAVRPEDLQLPNTATDLCQDTWMLSGSSVMENGALQKQEILDFYFYL